MGTIHEFVFAESTARAFDFWMSTMTEIYKPLTAQSRVRMIIDTRRSGLLPMTYTMQHTRRWLRETPVHPPARVVLLHNNDRMVSLMSSFMQTLRLGHLTVKTFGRDERDAAVAWLLESF